MYQVIADGMPWIDADGKKEFSRMEAEELFDRLEHLGYSVEIYSACHSPAHI